MLAATIVVILVFLFDIVSGGVMRHGARAVGEVLWSASEGTLGKIGESGFFSSRAALAQENATLSTEVAQLQGAQAALSAAESENAQLRALVHLASVSSGITAPVTSSFQSSPYGTFQIGAGSAEGVRKGDLVETADGFALGTVSDVAGGSALVSELFAPGSKIDALVDGIPLTLSGQGGGAASGDAPHGAAINESDTVTAASLAGRPIGVVGNVESSAASAATHVIVRLPVNLESLSFVYVETTR